MVGGGVKKFSVEGLNILLIGLHCLIDHEETLKDQNYVLFDIVLNIARYAACEEQIYHH